MRNRQQSITDAILERELFVSGMLSQCGSEGDRNQALLIFGAAIHPIMDSFSPEHVNNNGDPLEWNPWRPFGYSPFDFIGNETTSDITPEIYHDVAGTLISSYNNAF